MEIELSVKLIEFGGKNPINIIHINIFYTHAAV